MARRRRRRNVDLDPLPRGYAGLIKKVNAAIAELGEEDALVQEAMAVLVGVMRGDSEFLGRHCAVRIRAAKELLDRRLGPPGEPIKGKDNPLEDYEAWRKEIWNPEIEEEPE